MYIRTKNRIYKVESETCDKQGYFIGDYDVILKKQVIKQVDTIEELCDGFYIDFVNYEGFDKDKIGEPYTFEEFRDCFLAYREYEGNQYTHCEGYGFIKTNKGFIYIAKMNQRGELELL